MKISQKGKNIRKRMQYKESKNSHRIRAKMIQRVKTNLKNMYQASFEGFEFCNMELETLEHVMLCERWEEQMHKTFNEFTNFNQFSTLVDFIQIST